MKRIFITGVVISALTSMASAADLSARTYTKAPVQVIYPAYNWTGFYIGAHVGVGWGDSDWEYYRTASGPIRPTYTRHKMSGGLAGGQFGYNHQVGSWVFGIEGEGSWADLNGGSPCPNPAFKCTTQVNWMASAAGRLGYAWNDVLLYGKGGGVWAGERHDNINPADPIINETSGDVTRSGYTVGAGLEFGFAPNWTSNLEYMYSDFGRRSVDVFRVGSGLYYSSIHMNEQIHAIKFGVNYHFNWSGQAAARY